MYRAVTYRLQPLPLTYQFARSLAAQACILLAWCVGAAATARNWSNRPSGCRSQAAGTGTSVRPLINSVPYYQGRRVAHWAYCFFSVSSNKLLLFLSVSASRNDARNPDRGFASRNVLSELPTPLFDTVVPRSWPI